ncbi:MAG: hypothetical protein VXZ72_00790 [Chlamydiota bacterium]|nr:hypothetical protein [Chlamydiota bacterium]
MSLRTTKTNEAFYDVISVFDFDGVSRLSGLTDSNFTISFYKNGVAQSVTSTIAEIGTTGEYLLTVADGFSSKGFWVISTYLDETEDTYRTDIEVRSQDIDTVYTLVGTIDPAAVTGLESVVLTAVDTGNSDAPIPGMLVNVWNSTSTTLLTYSTTDSLGQISFSIDPGDYVAKCFKAGVSVSDQAFTVTSSSSSVQNFTISAETVAVAAPSAPNLCRLYADFINQAGSAVTGFKVTVTNMFSDQASSSSGLSIVGNSVTYESNSSGHVEFDIVIGAKIQIALVGTGLTREITVPDQATANILTLLGDASDPFTVVEDTTNPFVVVSVS